MRHVRWISGLAAVAAIACSDPSEDGKAPGGGGERQLVRVDVTPADPVTIPGGRVAFHATGTFDDGSSADLTGTATWASSNGAVASIANDGTATAERVGSTTIRASLGGVSGSTSLSVRALELASIRIEPPVATVSPGGEFPLRAIGRDASGAEVELNGAADWASADAAVAQVTGAGLATGVAIGATRVTASWGGKTATAYVAVQAARLVAIELSTPAFVHLGVGAQGTVEVSGVWSDGTRSDLSGVAAIASDAPGVVETGWTRYGTPTLRCVAAGTAHVTATYGAFVSTTELLVTQRALAWLELEASPSPLPAGLSVPMRAVAVYDDFTAADVTASATWSVEGDAATVASPGVLTGAAAGTAIVTASFGGFAAHALVTVIGDAPLGLDVVVDEPTLVAGGYSWVDTYVRYADGSRAEVSDWSVGTSSDPAIARVQLTAWHDNDVLAVAPGTATITGTYAGLTDAATVTVLQPTSITLSAPDRVTVGSSFRVVATAASPDPAVRSADLLFAGEWSSSDPSVLALASLPGTRGYGWVEARAPGTATITVRHAGLEASRTIQVLRAGTWLEVTPGTAEVMEGASVHLRAIAHLDDGTELDVSGTATWAASGAVYVSYWMAGDVTGQVAGTGMVTARLGDLTGAAAITVKPKPPDQMYLLPAATPGYGTSTYRLPVGATQRFSIGGSFYDGRTFTPTAPVTWTSANPAVAAFSTDPAHAGELTTLAKGSTQLSGTYAGRTVSATLVVDDLLDVTFAAAAAVPIGGTASPSVKATWPNGTGTTQTDVSYLATLESARPDVVAASPGRVTGLVVGIADVTASFGSFSQVIPVTVRLPAWRAPLLVSGGGATLVPVGDANPVIAGARLETMGTYDYLDVTDLATFSVTSGPATVSGTPVVLQGTAAGTATLTATYAGVSGTANVTFVDGVERLEISPTVAELPEGAAWGFVVTAPGSSGYDDDVTRQAVIVSSDPAVVTAEQGSYGGTLRAHSPGTAVVTATYGGRTAELVVYVRDGTPWVSVDVGWSQREQPLHVRERLHLMANETVGSDTDVTAAATWASSDPSVLKVVAPGVVEAVAPGVATVTAGYAGGTARRTLAVSDATLEGISVGVPALALPAGTERPLPVTGLFSDDANPAPQLTSAATFASENASVVGIDPARPYVLQAKAVGVTYVTATVGTKTVRIPVTVF